FRHWLPGIFPRRRASRISPAGFLTFPKGVMAMRPVVPMRTFRRPARPRRSTCQLLIEQLECRSLLSVQVLATLGDAVPGGVGFRINDFEPNGLNDRGDVLFGNDLGTTPDPESFYGEGVFLRSHGQETLLARAGAGAPGGGTFDFGFLGT